MPPSSSSFWNPENIRDVGESIGANQLSREVTDHLGHDIDFRIMLVIDSALKFMKNAKRTTLHTDDISQDLLEALKKANNGGTVHLPSPHKYVIGQRLDLTFLKDIEIRLDGTIQFTDDVEFWQQPNYLYKYPFQGSVSWWKWGGENVKLYGVGTIDGKGQRWWDELNGRTYDEYPRPILFYATNLSNFRMEGILLKDSPDWTQLYVYCTCILAALEF